MAGLILLAWVGAASAADPPAVVYGIEIDVRGARERVLIFASEERTAAVKEGAGGKLELVFPRAVLDPSAPTQVRPLRVGAVRDVSVREVRGEREPEVRITIARRGAAEYEIEARGSTTAVSFARVRPANDEGVALSFENAELREIVEAVAKLTGERFIFDEGLAGRASIVSTTRIPSDAVLTLLHSLLHVSGFSAVPTPSGTYRIVPIAEATAHATFRPGGGRRKGDAPVTMAIPLASADAADVASRLAAYVGKKATLIAHAPSNTLILTGSESHAHTLLDLIKAFDTGAGTDFWLRHVRHRDAVDIASQLERILRERPGKSSRASISIDPRGQLLVVVAPPDELLEIRGLVAGLDVRPDSSGEVHVYRLRHADPTTIAEVLNGLAQGTREPRGGRGRAIAGLTMRAVVDQGSGALVIRADPETYRSVAELLDELDRPAPRIEVEVTLLEVLASNDLSLGFDAFVPAAAGNSATAGGAFLNPSGGGLFQPGSSSGPDFALRYSRAPVEVPVIGPGGVPLTVLVPRESFVVTADESFVASRVLQRPHLTILAGEQQEIFAGDNVPVPVAAENAGADPLTTRLTIERYDVGVSLRVAASIGEAGRVRLDLDVESSRLGNRALAGAPPNTGPVIEERTLSTVLWLDEDKPALIGGAELQDTSLTEVGTPWFRDIPLLGTFARSSTNRRVKVYLVIAAQAFVHRDPSDDIAASIRRRLGFERAMSRRKDFDVGSDPSWGLRVATRTQRDDAEAIASHFELGGATARVSTWEAASGERHDVVLLGYENLAELGEAAKSARAGGFTPELISLPGAAE